MKKMFKDSSLIMFDVKTFKYLPSPLTNPAWVGSVGMYGDEDSWVFEGERYCLWDGMDIVVLNDAISNKKGYIKVIVKKIVDKIEYMKNKFSSKAGNVYKI